MTLEELLKQTKQLQKQQDAAYNRYQKKMDDLQHQYIKEHQPLQVKKYQRIIVRLRDDKRERNLCGIFLGWGIGDDGSVRPCFYGGKPSYNRTDQILSVELSKEQPEGDCKLCRLHKEGLCYMLGGEDMGKKYATHRVKEGDVVCPHYEEKTELWDRWQEGVHYPHVTRVREGRKTVYRIYNKAWTYFTEYSEEDVRRHYLTEPPTEEC